MSEKMKNPFTPGETVATKESKERFTQVDVFKALDAIRYPADASEGRSSQESYSHLKKAAFDEAKKALTACKKDVVIKHDKENETNLGTSADVAIDIAQNAERFGISREELAGLKGYAIKGVIKAYEKDAFWMAKKVLKHQALFDAKDEDFVDAAPTAVAAAQRALQKNKSIDAVNAFDEALRMGAKAEGLLTDAASYKKMFGLAVDTGRIAMAIKLYPLAEGLGIEQSYFVSLQADAKRRAGIERKTGKLAEAQLYAEHAHIFGLTPDEMLPPES